MKKAGNVPDYIQKEQERVKSSGEMGGGRVVWWKAKVGRNVVRILPPKGGGKYYFGTRQHFVPGDAGKDLPIVCLRDDPKHQEPKVCPLCQYVAELRESDEEKFANNLAGKSRYYMNIIDKGAEKEGNQVLGCGSRMHVDILGVFTDPDIDMDITNPESGCDVIIVRVGEKRNDTRYTVHGRVQSLNSPIEFDPEQLADLDSLVMQVSFEELEEMVEELKKKGSVSRPGASEEAEEDEENKIEKAGGTRHARGKEPPKQKAKTPKCIGRLDPDDELCKECDFSEECEEIVKQGKKETGEKPGTLKKRMEKK